MIGVDVAGLLSAELVSCSLVVVALSIVTSGSCVVAPMNAKE